MGTGEGDIFTKPQPMVTPCEALNLCIPRPGPGCLSKATRLVLCLKRAEGSSTVTASGTSDQFPQPLTKADGSMGWRRCDALEKARVRVGKKIELSSGKSKSRTVERLQLPVCSARRASPCISPPWAGLTGQPAACWHPRPSALRPTAGSGPDSRTPGTVEDGSAPCPAFRSPAVSPCGEKPCCFQISPAEETLELGRLVSPGNCDTLSPRAAGFYACHVRSLIPCGSTKGRWPLTASAAGLSRSAAWTPGLTA
nr:uncharacterized protein LOC129015138 [Pongo pygmaeus]